MFDLNGYLGLHTEAMQIRTQRSQLLANNIANADTPNYKARDIDFRQMLQRSEALTAPKIRLQRTQPGHFADDVGPLTIGEAGYRIPMQPTLDGNTVEADVELSAFADNALRYQATLRFLSGRISGLRDAITGGR
jgi:flagellar basal-body rod protein FlgB